MVGRRYVAPISIGTVSAQVDIFEILAAAGKPIALCGWYLGQTSEVGDAQEEELALILKYVTGAPTSGSGGGTSTFRPVLPNDAAAGVTIETGNTTKLTGGTSVELRRFAWNVRTPEIYLPTPEFWHVADASTRFVLELATTPADAITAMVGHVDVMELV